MGKKSDLSKKYSENGEFPSYSDLKYIISKDDFLIYREMNINPIKVFQYIHRQVFGKIFHAAQCYGELTKLHNDDIVMAIIEAADFGEFERNQSIAKMKKLEERQMDRKVKRSKEIVKGNTEEDKYREVGEICRDDDEIKKVEWKGSA